MTTVYRYKIYCNSDNKWEYKWDTSALSVCPTDSGHDINSMSVMDELSKKFNSTITLSSSTEVIISSAIYNCDSSSTVITISLPPIANNIGVYFYFSKTSANNTVTIQGYNGETIDGNVNIVLSNLSDNVMISTEDGTGWVSNPDYIEEDITYNMSGNISSYSTVVSNDPLNPGKYRSIYEAFNNGEKNVFVKSGIYVEPNEIIIPNGGKLTGEHFGSVYVIAGRIKVDGSSGVKEDKGTISIDNGFNNVVGTGTTFTNISVGNQILISNNFLTILSIEDDTHLTLTINYNGISVVNSTYIAQNVFLGIEVSNLIIANSPVTGLYIRAVKHSVFNHITVLQSASNNIQIVDSADSAFKTIVSADSQGSGIVCDTCFDLLFEICNVYNNVGYGIKACGKGVFIVFDKCSSSCNTNCGIYITDYCSEVVITNCLAKMNNNIGILVDEFIEYCTVSNCIMHGNNLNGLEIRSSDCIVTSNISRLNKNHGMCIKQDGHVIGNVCSNNTIHGMYILGNNSNINANTLKSNTGDGLNITGSSCTINGNITFYNENGITMNVNSDDNTVTSNQSKSNKTINMNDNGANNGLSNNK